MWTALGVVIAGFVGYWVASLTIGELNKRVMQATQELGKVQAQTERIEKDNDELMEKAKALSDKNKKLDDAIKEAERRLDSALKTDTSKLVAAIELLNRNPDIKTLTEKVSSLESQVTTLAAPQILTPSEGCLLIGNRKIQMCWGVQILEQESHIRRFRITFPKPFAARPTVIPGINTHSDGQAPAIYQNTITETNYVGAVNNMNEMGKLQTGRVELSYVAIGAPAVSP